MGKGEVIMQKMLIQQGHFDKLIQGVGREKRLSVPQ